ncbi:hypothetical protein LTA6_000381 [Microbacterium sp. LTA6]|uniref:hypothetical protein n=1 Tax=Microbacterium sp. LTA6 TaxID=3129771 RepID=UPI00324F2335
MNSTNRVLNRGLLLICGLILLAGGAAAVVLGVRPAWAEPGVERSTKATSDLLAQVGTWVVDVPGAGSVSGAAIVLIGVALVLAVVLLVFVFTRGKGKTPTVLSVDAGSGRTSVDRNVAEAVLGGSIADRPDVISARTGVYLVKRERAIELTVTVQRGASLGRVLDAAESAVDDWDALIGTSVPVMLHLADRSWRDGLRSRTRVR